jgi:hypothetical protein
MARVFVLDPDVTKNPKFNTASLEKFGKVAFIFNKSWTMSPLRPAASLKAMRRALESQKFDPFTDYIVLTGPFHTINLLIWALARAYEPIRVLMFDARNDGYVEHVLTEDESHVQA